MYIINNGFDFFQDHTSRREDVSLAKSLDVKASASWIGHPYFDVIDNSSDFENKICRMIAVDINKMFIISLKYLD